MKGSIGASMTTHRRRKRKNKTLILATVSVNRGTSTVTEWLSKKVYEKLREQGLIVETYRRADSRWVKR